MNQMISPVIGALAGVGCVASALVAYRLLSFVHLYLLHASAIQRYNRPQSSAWALVTGASDGVGKATARELQKRGFNVILHGRNHQKLEGVAAELNKEFPSLRTELVVGDAMDPMPAVDAVVKTVARVKHRGGSLTILINNLGGGGIFGIKTYNEYTELDPSMIDKMMNLNERFPMQLVRALLPTLQQNQPSLILNLSSYASLGSPFLVPYSSAKSAINIFSMALLSEMQALGKDIEIKTLMLGSVITPGNYMEKKHFLAETPETMAQSILDCVGCSQMTVAPSWRHCLMGESLAWVPESVAQKGLQDAVLTRRAAEQELLKKS